MSLMWYMNKNKQTKKKANDLSDYGDICLEACDGNQRSEAVLTLSH